ncbi:hypothetical protein [Acidimangrovimonas pyrenivorans]|uniref:Uncharacterized protein n=1 Tax=Acidimangrovimonas pyrenivorans TaxID=2030798 RepID=A0ABV7AD60_9RHOB
MIRCAALVLMLTAGTAVAEGGPTPAQVKALADAIASAGCVVNEDNQAQVLKAAGMTEDQGAAVIDRLAWEGRIKPVGVKQLRLVGGEVCK